LIIILIYFNFTYIECKEYSELIYFKIPDPILTTSSKGNHITKTDCYIASPLITNGEDAEPKEFPHMVTIWNVWYY